MNPSYIKDIRDIQLYIFLHERQLGSPPTAIGLISSTYFAVIREMENLCGKTEHNSRIYMGEGKPYILGIPIINIGEKAND